MEESMKFEMNLNEYMALYNIMLNADALLKLNHDEFWKPKLKKVINDYKKIKNENSK